MTPRRLRRVEEAFARLEAVNARLQHYLRQPPTRILIVDDEPGICHALKRVLRQGGYEDIVAVGTARAGREALAANDVALALLDQRLPDGDGWRLAAEAPRLTAVCLMSGIIHPTDLEAIRRRTRADAVVSVADVDHLLGTVARLIGRGPSPPAPFYRESLQ